MKIERRNDLSLRLLEVFGAVMQHQTTVRSAEALGISQPAVSTAIKALEAQVGFALFERRNRRILPTEEALDLYREVEPIFAMLRSVEGRVRDLRAGAAGKLRIMATPPLGHSLAPVALKRFLDARPNVVIDFDVRRAETVAESVAVGAADIGLVLLAAPRSGVEIEEIADADMVALIPPTHPLAARDAIAPPEAAAAGFVGLHTGSRLGEILRDSFRSAGTPYAPRVEVRYCHTAAVLAQAGLGVAVVDRYTAGFMQGPDLVQRRFRPAISAPCCLLTRADAPVSQLTRHFADDIRAAVRADAAR
ncbi:MAG: LysR family transcriptional regulator [Rhodobacteraceae bacterium]|nr:LysR family transcriptional regulator [Paracoccaceae bacterium]